MRGGEVEDAIFLSIPISNQAGTNMIAPPIPNDPPIKPALKPNIMACFIKFYDILSC